MVRIRVTFDLDIAVNKTEREVASWLKRGLMGIGELHSFESRQVVEPDKQGFRQRQIHTLLEEQPGLTMRQIADYCGVTLSTAYKVVSRMGSTVRRKRSDPNDPWRYSLAE